MRLGHFWATLYRRRVVAQEWPRESGDFKMAQISRRSNGKWKARVRSGSQGSAKDKSKDFDSKVAAQQWAYQQEYGTSVVLKKDEVLTVDYVIRQFIGATTLDQSKKSSLEQTAADFEDYPVAKLDEAVVLIWLRGVVKFTKIEPSTAQKRVDYLKQALELYGIENGLETNYKAVSEAKKVLEKEGLVGASNERDRRLNVEENEEQRLYEHCPPNPWIADAIEIALLTCKRVGEIHGEQVSYINFKDSTCFIPSRKNPKKKGGSDEIIPVPPRALEIYEKRIHIARKKSYAYGKQLWPLKNAYSISDRFAKVRQSAGIEDLHFHDLRHEGISRLFEIEKIKDGYIRKWTIPEVAKVSGHKTWKMLERYTQLKPKDLVDLF